MDDHAFEDELCARILACAQVMRRDLAQRAWEAKLARSDLLALRQMIRRDDCFSPSEIARVLNCTRGNATKIIERLARAKYVSAYVDPCSPKYKSVSVTNAGREAYASIMRRIHPDDRFLRLSREERRELYRLLGRVGPRLNLPTVVD
jgi:DNA-binding MarR family transcriptional regulator